MLFLDMEFLTLKLKAEDTPGRQHILTIKLRTNIRYIHTQKGTRIG